MYNDALTTDDPSMRLKIEVHEFRVNDTVVDDETRLAVAAPVGEVDAGAVVYHQFQESLD